MGFNIGFKCRMGGEDMSNVQFNQKLWNLRSVVSGTKDAVKIPACPKTYAHVVCSRNVVGRFKPTAGQVSSVSANPNDAVGGYQSCPFP